MATENKRPDVHDSMLKQASLFILFLICGLAVFVFGSTYYTLFPTNKNVAYITVLAAVFLASALWLKRTEHPARYWPVAFAFFIASFALLATLLVGGFSGVVLGWFNAPDTTSEGQAIAKLYEMGMIVVPIIALTKLSGGDLGSIFLKRGNLKWGLGVGTLIFFNFASSAFLFFASRYNSLDKLAAATLWGVVFAFANGFMEEVWLRGIFLKRFEPLLGFWGAIVLTSITFSLMHTGAVYLTPAAIPFMLANTLSLGLACGYLTLKTGSIWGATLVHAAADLFLFIAMLASV